jgi:hypothetical protein
MFCLGSRLYRVSCPDSNAHLDAGHGIQCPGVGSLITVAGHILNRYLDVIAKALVQVMEDEEKDEELTAAIDEALRSLFSSIGDAEGLNTLMLLLLDWYVFMPCQTFVDKRSHTRAVVDFRAKDHSARRRVSACDLFATFCISSELDASLYRVDWVRQLVSMLEDTHVPVHTAAWKSFDIFVKSVPKDELESLVVPLRRTIESIGGPGIYVPGLNLPKGVSPTVPIIIAGLITGNNDQREQAALAISDLVERTDGDAIKPFVVPFTGPLIRVSTQAMTYPPSVKTAILTALTTMLERIPTFVKPFFPQLQRTFIKNTSEPSSVVVRTKAAVALGALMKNQSRVDPVIVELIAGAKSSNDAIGSSLVLSISNVVKSAGSNVGDKSKEACAELVSDAFKEDHDGKTVAI